MAKIFDLQQIFLLQLCTFLDTISLLSLLRSCKTIYSKLNNTEKFWRMICTREDLDQLPCLEDDGDLTKLGWNGTPMRVLTSPDLPQWRRFFLRGLQMQRNVRQGNVMSWRVDLNSSESVRQLSPADAELAVPYSDNEDDFHAESDVGKDVVWSDRFLVAFASPFMPEEYRVRVWDISVEPPQFLYSVLYSEHDSLDLLGEGKVSAWRDHVVITLKSEEAGAILRVLSIEDRMKEVASFAFPVSDCRSAYYTSSSLRVVVDEVVVVCRCDSWWWVYILSLPDCLPKREIRMDMADIHPNHYSYTCEYSSGSNTVILFGHYDEETSSRTYMLVTLDIAGSESKVRTAYPCSNIRFVLLFANEIFIVREDRSITQYDEEASAELPCTKKRMLSGKKINALQHMEKAFNEKPFFNPLLDEVKARAFFSTWDSVMDGVGSKVVAGGGKFLPMIDVRSWRQGSGGIRLPKQLQREDCDARSWVFESDRLVDFLSDPAVMDIHKFY